MQREDRPITWRVAADCLPFIPGLEGRVGDVVLVWQHAGYADARCCPVVDIDGGHWAVQRDHPGEDHTARLHPCEDFSLYCVICGEEDVPRPVLTRLQAEEAQQWAQRMWTLLSEGSERGSLEESHAPPL